MMEQSFAENMVMFLRDIVFWFLKYNEQIFSKFIWYVLTVFD